MDSGCDQALAKVRAACKKRGAVGAKGLGRMFRIYNDDHNKTLNFDEFKTGLEDYGCKLTDEEVKSLYDYFNKDGSADGIDFDEFMVAFRKPLEGSRLKVVQQAFKKADKTGDGVLDWKDLKRVYNCREHPKYKNGEWTEKEVFEEFLHNFEPNDKDGKVTQKEFELYYSCLGANIDNDAYFDLMIRNAWKL
ncbi:calcyphosin-like protein [Acropora millepora]|uniref:calcyphosin-like protein n=1 Tax=Acropora millepora TaxID=45264 RepID=UPI001CF4C99B|nr:calcyphosin-like protein [Acropora millepora]XP_029200127.2 calcyphosin-like protein [Acropora millepora]XP_044164210.1 calcyphosin-like protein [Acropora millepora]